MSERRVIIEIGPNPPARLDKALARDVPEKEALSRSRLAALLAEGAICRGNVVMTNPKAKVTEGEIYEVRVPAAQEGRVLAQDIALDILFEDEAVIVVNKPAGMVVHPAPGSPDNTLVNALLGHCGATLAGVGGAKRPGIVHRIDKDTSGLLVVAKSDAAHHGLATQFEAHSVTRKYLALCHGVPSSTDPRLKGVKGVSFEPGNIVKITSLLGRHRSERQKQAVSFTSGRHAVTRTRVFETFGVPGAVALVQCQLETGRTHQIRVHMAHIGHALVGDPTYGGRRRASVKALGEAAAQAVNAFPRQALHARSLGFDHPITGARLEFQADPPEDIARMLGLLARAGET